MKREKNNSNTGLSSARQWLTLRVRPEEKSRVKEQADLAGLAVGEFMRRRIFGGRPVLAQTDETMLRELRRVGGLLKYNFETLRGAGCPPEMVVQMNEALCLLVSIVERVGAAYQGTHSDSIKGQVRDR